jgi:hypothetical protein
MEYMEEAIKKDPTLPGKWRIEGEKRYNAYLQRQYAGKAERPTATEIIVPIVFHLVDSATTLAGITDRDIYEQVEILNRDFGGAKADLYKTVIPPEITARVGRISLKFVLARRTPDGVLTTGIERRVNTTPDHINIKANATGGLDAWDVTKYVNVWAGTFSGNDLELLGIATFPFTTGEGAQGLVISISSLPYTSPTVRGYYPEYSEGATLSHEIGHYFYLYHTFGDQNVCNNADFRLQDGWPLPAGAGPQGDDTPDERAGPGNAYFGNPSENYSDGCTTLPFGMMYGSFMNYFDDRSLFMFSNGSRKRVEACIDLYRVGLLTSDGATPPVDVTDAFMVNVTPRGTPECKAYVVNNTPLTARVRNTGTGNLTRVTVNVELDGVAVVPIVFPLTLAPGEDTILNLAPITGSPGFHALTVYTNAPNSTADTFSNNDTLLSYIFIQSGAITAPFKEDFTSTTFPPSGWQTWNPDSNTTWIRDTTSGFTAAGAATVQNYHYGSLGEFDDLITPAIDLGTSDSASLSFEVAYAAYDITDVSVWDGLEVYVSGDGGSSYDLAYKKTGNQLKTAEPAQSNSFAATPDEPTLWRTENINLTPYIIAGKKMLVKFRNTTAFGNNLYIDDISVSGEHLLNRDAYPFAISGFPSINCTNTISPVVFFATNGLDTLKTLIFNTQIDNGSVNTFDWTGSLVRGQPSQVAIGPITGIQAGNHVLTVYTSNPNGLTDLVPSNDTIRQPFSIITTISGSVSEGFESTTFPPVNWVIDNPDRLLTWERTTSIAKTGIGSMVIRNYDYTTANTNDKFVSPIITLSSVPYDSLFVSFDYAYAQGIQYPGSINSPLDTLEVQVTPDCGHTFTTIWKKWGEELQTINDPNRPLGSIFTPNSEGQWKNINLYLDPVVNNKDFQVYFVAKSNKQNNLYLDNINIYTKVLPQKLKDQGYLIYPNPFKGSFIIRNYRVPTTLQSVGIYNSVGQLVWAKDLNGSGNTEMTVDLRNLAAGVYVVKLNYLEKTIVERIVKQ